MLGGIIPSSERSLRLGKEAYVLTILFSRLEGMIHSCRGRESNALEIDQVYGISKYLLHNTCDR